MCSKWIEPPLIEYWIVRRVYPYEWSGTGQPFADDGERVADIDMYTSEHEFSRTRMHALRVLYLHHPIDDIVVGTAFRLTSGRCRCGATARLDLYGGPPYTMWGKDLENGPWARPED